MQPKFKWRRLSRKWEYIIWPSRARTHRRADGGGSNRIRWGSRLLLEVPCDCLLHRCQGLKLPPTPFGIYAKCPLEVTRHSILSSQSHFIFCSSHLPYLSFISSALVHPVNMRVSQLAVLIAASAASVSAVPTDYGKYPSMSSCSQPKRHL